MITTPARFFNIRDAVNIFIIGGENGLVIDSGYSDKKSLGLFKKDFNEIKENYTSMKINRILLTHAHQDHFSGLTSLRKFYGFKIISTEKMAQNIKSMRSYRRSYSYRKPEHEHYNNFQKILNKLLSQTYSFLFRKIYSIQFVAKPDIIIPEESTLEINNETWQIFHSPGHCDDHISLYNEEKGILFSGDNVIKHIATWLGPPKSNLDDYMKTLKKYKELPNLKIILPAHGAVIHNPIERIDELIEWRKKRTEDVLNLISSMECISRKDIMKKLYPNGKVKRYLAEGWIELTLKELVEKNKIIVKAEKGKVVYEKS